MDAEPRVVAEPADFARPLDAGSAAPLPPPVLQPQPGAPDRHLGAKAETRVRRIKKALAMLQYQEPAGAVRPAPSLE